MVSEKHTSYIIGVATEAVLVLRYVCTHTEESDDMSAAERFDATPYRPVIFPSLKTGTFSSSERSANFYQLTRQPALQSLPARFRTPMESDVPTKLYK
jgi:hypothetical protein